MPFPGAPDFSQLRLQQLFENLPQIMQALGGTGAQAGSPPNILPDPVNTEAAGVPPIRSSADITNELLSRLLNYTPETKASEALMGHIGAFPQREQYKPSGLRRVGAVLSGLGANNPESQMKVMEDFRNQPYNRALGDWEQKLKPLEFASTNERNYNTNVRQMQTQAVMGGARVQSAEAQGTRAQAALLNAQSLDFIRRNPEYKHYFDDQGNVYSQNPRNPEDIVYLFDEAGNNIKEWKVREAGLKIEGQKAIHLMDDASRERAARLRANATVEAAKVGATSREKVAEQKGWVAYDVPDPTPDDPTHKKTIFYNSGSKQVYEPDQLKGQELTKPGTERPVSNKPMTEAQGKIGDYRKARELKSNPKYEKWIHLDPRGPNTFDIDPVGTGSGVFGFGGPGLDEVTHGEIVEGVFGKGGGVPKTTPAAPPKGKVVKPEDEEVVVTVEEIADPTKRHGPIAMKKSSLESPEFKAKYRVVQ